MVEKFKHLKISEQMPQFFDFEGSALTKFIEYYYEWMETNQGPDFYSRRILDYNDVDYKKDEYEKFDLFLKNEFMKEIPATLQVDDRFLLKNIKDFYKSKGTEESMKLLFRILYNQDVEFDYPGRYILRASDGKWTRETSLSVVLLDDDLTKINMFNFVEGESSKAAAKIQRIEQLLVGGVFKTYIYIDTIFGEFIPGEYIRNRSTGENFAILSSEGMVQHTGRWTSTDGFLSWDRVLQDNYYYQEFSYVIKSGMNVGEYVDLIKKLNHPVGTLMFGEFNLRIEVDTPLAIDVDTAIYRFLGKTLTYIIPFDELINFETEASVAQGSVSGRYIFEYVVEEFNFDNNIVDFVTSSGTLDAMGYWLELTGPSDYESGDVLEIYDDNEGRITYRKIDAVVGNNVHLYEAYPYDVLSGLEYKLHKVDPDVKAEIYHMRNNLDIGSNDIQIRNLEDYLDLDDLDYTDIMHLTVDELLKEKYIFGQNFITEPVVRNTIIEVEDAINTDTGYYFVEEIISTHIIRMKEEYEHGEVSSGLDYKIHNT